MRRINTLDEEFHIMSNYTPSYDHEHYIPSDIVVNSVQKYEQYKHKFGMVHEAADILFINGKYILSPSRTMVSHLRRV